MNSSVESLTWMTSSHSDVYVAGSKLGMFTSHRDHHFACSSWLMEIVFMIKQSRSEKAPKLIIIWHFVATHLVDRDKSMHNKCQGQGKFR